MLRVSCERTQKLFTMLQHVHRLLQFQVVLFLLAQVAILYLQGAALRRHGNRCFLLLVISTVCGICVLIVSGALLVCGRRT